MEHTYVKSGNVVPPFLTSALVGVESTETYHEPLKSISHLHTLFLIHGV